MNFTNDWKLLVLQRWAGEYPPAKGNEDEAAVSLKSSQDIADDLQGAGNFTADEVSAFMAVNGYGVVFDAGYPKWKIKNGNALLID